MANESTNTVRVLIVDDSALMRKVLREILAASPKIDVVATAPDAPSAFTMAQQLRPDVVTLDIQMPGKSGLEILPDLVGTLGMRVVMVSSLTREGAEETIAALELGAVDFLPKPERNPLGELRACGDLLVEKVLAAARSRIRKGQNRINRPPRPGIRTGGPALTSGSEERQQAPSNLPCLVLGISTGGPEALSQTLPMLEPPLPPILVVQHMPATFTSVFAARLGRRCSVPVKEAAAGDPVISNQILIAPGGRHMLVSGHPPHCTIALADGPAVSGHKPSVDMLFQSAARAYGGATVGIIMTGMGRDGVEGCKRILSVGGATFGQDEETSVVYGMNKAAFLEGAVQAQFPLEALPSLIERFSKPTAAS